MPRPSLPDPGRDKPRRCEGCGYDLRGLAVGARCPECGLPSYRSVKPELDDPLSRMPIEVIRTFRRACRLASACVLALLVAELLAVLQPGTTGLQPWARLVLAAWWFLAALALTRPFDVEAAIMHGFGRRGRLRLYAGWLQAAWIAAAAAHLVNTTIVATAGGPTAGAVRKLAPWLDGITIAAVVAGLTGVLLLGILLGRLAEWARDRQAAAAFNMAVWGVPLSTALMFVDLPILLAGLFVLVIWCVAVGAFPYAMLNLTRSVEWSVKHAREHQERETRRTERRERFAADVRRSIQAIDARDTKPGR